MSKYDPLGTLLTASRSDRVEMTFLDLERALGFRLPPSARQHQAWWANTGGSHVHAQAWLKTGWRTSQTDLASQRVVFVRSGRPDVVAGGRPAEGVAEPGTVFERGLVAVDLGALTPAGDRLIADVREELDCGSAEAIIAAINAFALNRRRQLIQGFVDASPQVGGDSTEIIRSDRDAR